MTGPDTKPAAKGFSFARLIPLLVLIAGLILFVSLGLHRYFTFDSLREHREWLLDQVAGLGGLAPLVYVVAYAILIAFSIPGGAIFTIVGGFLFGLVPGTICVVVGATLGASAVFIAARTALGDLLRAKAGPALKRMEDGFKENAFSYLLVLRLIPIFPFWLVNLVPAFLGVPLRTYVLGTFIGIIPGTFVFVSVGNGLGEIFAAGESPDLGIIFSPAILIPILGLALLSLLPVVYKRVKARRKPTD